MFAPLILFAAAIAGQPEASRVAAAPDEIIITVTALDLASERGRASTMHRIAQVAEEYCGSYAAVEFDQWDGIKRCRGDVMASATRQLAAMTAPTDLRLAVR